MIKFKLLDNTTSKEAFVQINPVHIVSSETVVDTDWVEELNSQCHLAYSTYHLVTGKQLQVCVVLPVTDYLYNRETDKWDIPHEIPREDFIESLTNSLNFNVTFIKWSK